MNDDWLDSFLDWLETDSIGTDVDADSPVVIDTIEVE